jgi:hypothetical protein
VKALLERDPPYGAKVTLRGRAGNAGWNAPALAPWLDRVDELRVGTPLRQGRRCHMGEGGSIPFMGMLGQRFPEAQFLITGVLGPGIRTPTAPTSSLHIPTGKRLTACVAQVIADHATR